MKAMRDRGKGEERKAGSAELEQEKRRTRERGKRGSSPVAFNLVGCEIEDSVKSRHFGKNKSPGNSSFFYNSGFRLPPE